MSVLIFIDQSDKQLKKTSYEAISYGVKLAEQLGVAADGVLLGESDADPAALGAYGLKTIWHAAQPALNDLDSQIFTDAIAAAMETSGATILVLSNNMNGRALAPRLSIRLKAGLVSGAVALPDTSNGFVVRKNVFSGKAFANVSILTDKKIIALNPNAYPVSQGEGSATVTPLNYNTGEARIRVTKSDKVEGEIPLSEAERVISGGRGLKGPENWGMIEELAGLLQAATACSRAVADAGWRPHHEHVGQTGLAIAPNLYMAIGISGAIQHLAGVNRSKVIVVINKDPEAPFFKAADYGIVGDAFEVVPKMIEAVKKLKGVS